MTPDHMVSRPCRFNRKEAEKIGASLAVGSVILKAGPRSPLSEDVSQLRLRQGHAN